jgi:hypothetical protein
MGNRDDLDFIAAHPVHEAERKAREDIPSGTPSVTGPHQRVLGDGIDRVPQFFAKSVGHGEVSGGVPFIGRFRLLRCGRVEPDSGRGHSAPVQPGPNLFPGDGLDRA